MYGVALAGFLTALCVNSQSARAEVTAGINKDTGTLEITVTPGEMKGVLLTGHLTEEISVFADDGTLVKSFPRTGISKVDILGVTRVTFQHFGTGGVGFEFEGDIVVDVFNNYPYARSSLDGLSLRGDLLLRGNAGIVAIDQDFSLALIDGNLTVQDGGFGFPQYPGLLWVTGDLTFISTSEGVGGWLENVFIGRDLIVNGGPHNEFISVQNVVVEGDALMRLGPTNREERDFSDFVQIFASTIKGDLIIDGEQGDDTVWLGNSTIEGNLFIDMGPGADEVRFFFNSLNFGTDTQIFLDGGNGTSDELILDGLILDADEHTGFETVTP